MEDPYDHPAPGDEFALVDDFASILDISGCTMDQRPGRLDRPPALCRMKEGQRTHTSTRQSVLLGDVPRRRSSEVSRVAIGADPGNRIRDRRAGQVGPRLRIQEQKYNLNSIPGEQFTGLQLMCLMHAGFRVSIRDSTRAWRSMTSTDRRLRCSRRNDGWF